MHPEQREEQKLSIRLGLYEDLEISVAEVFED